ncbi:hypothetical protein [Halobacillus litoralis]|uniref:hypothetical protein n=1 Tax=Halobacillus litoralis TaxID=45668 RepID=UPI00136A7A57|nr:hypothetical protein [Halobacillus litoralis]MYL37850.1 hypothetical protein [Halobacillus litoralis]
MKRFIKIASTVLMSGAVFLFFQWSMTEQMDQEAAGAGEIVVHKESGALTVSLTYHNLAPGIYKVSWPEPAGEVSCSYEDERPCWLERDQLNYEGGDPVTVHYQRPFDGGFLPASWLVELYKDGESKDIPLTVTVKDFSGEAFVWTAPVTVESDIAMEHVHYYRFQRTGEPFPLFAAHAAEDVWRTGDNVVIYHKSDPLTYAQKKVLRRALNGLNGTVVELDHNHTGGTVPFMTVKNREVEKLEGEILGAHLQQASSGSSDFYERVLKDLYLSEPPGTKASGKLREGLAEPQLQAWKKRMLAAEQVEDIPAFLDGTLSEVNQGETRFFQKRRNDKDAPFFFTFDHDLYFHNTRMEGQVVQYKQTIYFPLVSILEASGYSWAVLDDGKVFRIQTEDNHYRFFLDQETFIVNEESFGTGKEVIISLDKTVYMKQDELKQLLDIQAVKGKGVWNLQKK